MRAKLLFLSILLFPALAVGGRGEPAATVAAMPLTTVCARSNNVGYWNLPAVLNHYNLLCGGQIMCVRGSLAHYQHKQIAGYGDIAQWLWTGNATATFSIAQQNAIMASATSLANANRPSGKFVVNISYFNDFLVGPGGYFVGANINYADCSGPGHSLPN